MPSGILSWPWGLSAHMELVCWVKGVAASKSPMLFRRLEGRRGGGGYSTSVFSLAGRLVGIEFQTLEFSCSGKDWGKSEKNAQHSQKER